MLGRGGSAFFEGANLRAASRKKHGRSAKALPVPAVWVIRHGITSGAVDGVPGVHVHLVHRPRLSGGARDKPEHDGQRGADGVGRVFEPQRKIRPAQARRGSARIVLRASGKTGVSAASGRGMRNERTAATCRRANANARKIGAEKDAGCANGVKLAR